MTFNVLQEKDTANGMLSKQILEEMISQGIEEFCVCPGARCAPLVYPLVNSRQVKIYFWPEERSAAFFALGRIKATQKPVAIVTTSGSAAAEILPATMEAYYSGLPLVLITADRPRRFRGKGAPQSAEQVGLYSHYVYDWHDLESGEKCNLDHWTRQGPIHLNICFEEPKDEECQTIYLDFCELKEFKKFHLPFIEHDHFLTFLQNTSYPFVVVGALSPLHHESAVNFLLRLNAPVYLESISGIREDPRLESLRITCIEQLWHCSNANDYPIDGILRIGGVPTARFWRDLENLSAKISICSISEQPFAGLSHADVIHTSLRSFFDHAQKVIIPTYYPFLKWKEADRLAQQALQSLFEEEPQAEPSLIHALSKQIPLGSKVYLGNSLPIREWDQAAAYTSRRFQISCSRGINGIDGQISTFLGYSSPEQDNWAIVGDLTMLYDLVAPWISSQLDHSINVVIVNNGGAGIFSRMFSHSAFQNAHTLHFESFAKFWGWGYERWESIPSTLSPRQEARVIELVPNEQSTRLFLKKVKKIYDQDPYSVNLRPIAFV